MSSPNSQTDTLISSRVGLPAGSASEAVGRFARRMILRHHKKLDWGTIEVTDRFGKTVLGSGKADEPVVHIQVNQLQFFSRCLFGGTVAAGESYIQGEWDCPELMDLMRILLRNRHQLTGMEKGAARVYRQMKAIRHAGRRNSRRGSRANISAHYDLGNDFFEQFLGETMMYSSAVYPSRDADLDTAQRHKLDLVCQGLNLQPGDKVIEIGTGWGGFALHAAEHYGVHVTTTTLSQEQHDYAQMAIEKKGLGDQITLLLDDYRDLQGSYDKLASIEMIEAVGHHYYSTFMQACSDLLRPGGTALIQAITIDENRYEEARDGVDFIKEFVFPGGCVPCISVLTEEGSNAGLRLTGLQDYAADYARTLAEWRQRFHAAHQTITKLGYSEAFSRLWHYYLCYCEAGFTEQTIGLAHLQFTKGPAELQ